MHFYNSLIKKLSLDMDQGFELETLARMSITFYFNNKPKPEKPKPGGQVNKAWKEASPLWSWPDNIHGFFQDV